MGGIPVNRINPGALKGEILTVTEKYKGFIIAIAPEGTRKKVERLKSGFLRIANETNSKIMMVGVDFSSKTIELGDFFSPSGDVEKDLKFIKDYFANFAGKRPELS
jgi:1-acyl-sn-glycerol-3-phosphate acyltransferase